MTTRWTALALLGLSACAQPVVGTDDDEIWSEGPIGGAGGAANRVDSTSASVAGTGGGGGTATAGCGNDEHFCGGVCTGNTPGTGCSQSASCDPCQAPEHATATCTAMGACDFTCDTGYEDVGGECTCASQCCSSADCSGDDVCASGACGPPPCYTDDCFVSCLLSLKCGGLCVGDTCTCLPCQ